MSYVEKGVDLLKCEWPQNYLSEYLPCDDQYWDVDRDCESFKEYLEALTAIDRKFQSMMISFSFMRR